MLCLSIAKIHIPAGFYSEKGLNIIPTITDLSIIYMYTFCYISLK